MMASNTVRIAVLPGDGIGTEVTQATLAVLEPLARRHGIGIATESLPAGAFHYQATGEAFPEASFRAAEAADAILLGAMGWPGIRQTDGTEIAPQLDLRFRLNLYAGVRPVRAIPGVPVALADPRARGIDFVLIRESTEGLFHSRGRGLVTEDYAEETLRITRATTGKLSRFAFRLAERRAARLGRRGRVTLASMPATTTWMPWRSTWCGTPGPLTCCRPRTCSATSSRTSRPGWSAAWASRPRPISATSMRCSSRRMALRRTSPARASPTRRRRCSRRR
jgi:3-isopropylmalate dehydrogenase